jgi:hypothetical protein
MSDFPTPPRGSGRGRHWQQGGEPTRYQRGLANTDSGFLPRIEEPYPPEDPVESNPGLYRVDVPGDLRAPPGVVRGPGMDYREGIGPEISQDRLIRPVRASVPVEGRAPDLVVPRVYLEPDESMDRLRQRAWRWGIFRDIVVIILGLFLISRWMLYPLYQAFVG